jgi:hypothetical protein
VRKRAKICSWPYACRALWTPVVVSDTEVYCVSHGRKIADTVTSQVVRERDRGCVRCGSAGPLDAAHVLVRGNHYTRFELENLRSLCRTCHEEMGRNPLRWRQFIDERYPGTWDRMVHLEIAGERARASVDLVDVIVRMRAQLGRVA